MGEVSGRSAEEKRKQSVAPAGPLFTHHSRIPDGTVRMSGRVEPGAWPAMRVVRAIHEGSYAGLVAAWSELMAWTGRERLAATEEAWECYLVGPDTELDPAKWRTQLNRPLV